MHPLPWASAARRGSMGVRIFELFVSPVHLFSCPQTKNGLPEHATKMEAFYESQKDQYDSFREQMLFARPVLAECIPIRKPLSGGKMIWLDIGGGTARNLEFLTVETIRNNFQKIIVVDVSLSLLEVWPAPRHAHLIAR